MQYIRLNPIIDTSEEALRNVTPAVLDQLEEFFTATPLKDQLNVEVRESGIFKDIEFIVAARYRENGDLIVRGEGFELNVSYQIRRMREAIS